MVPHNNPARDLEDVANALRSFYLRSHRVLDRAMTAQGASFARAKMLALIAQEGPLRSTDLASSFGYAPRTVTEAIDGLERDGLVRRSPDPDDRRAKRISLTPAGEAAVKVAETARTAHIDKVFSVLSADERAEVVRIVGKLNDRLAELGG